MHCSPCVATQTAYAWVAIWLNFNMHQHEITTEIKDFKPLYQSPLAFSLFLTSVFPTKEHPHSLIELPEHCRLCPPSLHV